jgi:hypothetical protein
MSNFMPRRQLRCFGLPILVFLSVFVAVLYQRAFGVGVLSDGWVLLEIGRQGFRKAREQADSHLLK